MYRLKKISNNFAHKIATELKYDTEKEAVMAYGFFAMMQVVLAILFVAIGGLIFGVFWQALIVSFAGAILRRYAGGVHAKSPSICIVVGTVICVGAALLASAAMFSNAFVAMGFSLCAFILSMVIIWRVAPVDSINKPIADRRKPKMKRGALMVVSIFLLISTALFSLYYVIINVLLLIFAVCIWFGVLWQVFTLTKAGETVLGFIDNRLSKPEA